MDPGQSGCPGIYLGKAQRQIAVGRPRRFITGFPSHVASPHMQKKHGCVEQCKCPAPRCRKKHGCVECCNPGSVPPRGSGGDGNPRPGLLHAPLPKGGHHVSASVHTTVLFSTSGRGKFALLHTTVLFLQLLQRASVFFRGSGRLNPPGNPCSVRGSRSPGVPRRFIEAGTRLQTKRAG